VHILKKYRLFNIKIIARNRTQVVLQDEYAKYDEDNNEEDEAKK
jgi:hypothetical protein